MPSPPTPAPSAVPIGGRRAWVGVCVAAIASFLYVADSGILALALPKIEHEFSDAPRSLLVWVAGGFLVAQASLLLVGGRLGDQRGRKRYYLIGLAIFSAGAGAASLAPTLGLLVAARVLQGVGAAFFAAGALALVLPLFPTDRAPSVIGVWGAVGSVAGWATPTLGSLVVERSWRLAFAMFVPFGILTIVLARSVLPEQMGAKNEQRTDRGGLLIGPPALGLVMLVLSQAPRWGWHSPLTLALAVVASVLVVGFVVRCGRVEVPLLDLSLFRNREFSANVLAGSMQQIGFFSWFITAPLIMGEVWGWSIRQSGLALALSHVVSSFGSPAGGWTVRRIGAPRVIVVGAVTCALGALWLVVRAASSGSFWTCYFPAALLIGLGSSWCGTVTAGSALAALEASELGIANSVQQLIRRIGGSVGVAIAIGLLGEARGRLLIPGARRVWVLSALAHLAIVAAVLWPSNPHGRRTGFTHDN